MNPVMVVRPAKRLSLNGVEWSMWCPGCERAHHAYEFMRDGSPGWDFDGNLDAPTFSPSLLVQSGNEHGPTRCHSFVRAGQWEFLTDCTHALAGQTVPLPPVPDWMLSLTAAALAATGEENDRG